MVPGWAEEVLERVPVAVGAHCVVRTYLSLLLFAESDDTSACPSVLPPEVFVLLRVLFLSSLGHSEGAFPSFLRIF